jgi:tetratricopeptide (TPR) repeat protein
MHLEPSSESYLARHALARDASGDVSAEIDSELRRALAMNPRDSAVLRALGLRAEGRGDAAEAERFLLQSTAADHSFPPQWALANFYLRTGQMDRLWPAVHQCFAVIEPRTPDRRRVQPEPLFELCWHATPNAKEILAQIPHSQAMLLPYLSYLVGTRRFDAAAEALPLALASPPSPSDVPSYLDLCEALLRENRTAPAVLVWNRLADSGRIPSSRLDPEKALSLTDADFASPLFDRGFGWQVRRNDKVFVREGERFLDFEMSEAEDEHFELLSKVLPVVGGRGYRLTWKADASRLDFRSRENPGLAIHLVVLAGELSPGCPPLLSKTVHSCLFTPPAGTTQLRLALRYDRPLGGIRLDGIVRLSDLALEFER